MGHNGVCGLLLVNIRYLAVLCKFFRLTGKVLNRGYNTAPGKRAFQWQDNSCANGI